MKSNRFLRIVMKLKDFQQSSAFCTVWWRMFQDSDKYENKYDKIQIQEKCNVSSSANS